MGVVFFPSLPSMGVMFFPSFVLGDGSREGGTLFVPLFPFSPLLPLSLPSSISPSFSHSLFLFFPLFPHLILLSFPTLLRFFPSLSSPSPSFSVSLPLFPFPSSSFFHLPFSLLRFFLFLAELLVLFVSEMLGMTSEM